MPTTFILESYYEAMRKLRGGKKRIEGEVKREREGGTEK